MFNPVRSRFSLAVGALFAVAALPASAGPSLEDSLALSMSKGVRDRMFWNLQAVTAKTKTKSEAPRDLTPQIVSIADLTAMRNQLGKDLFQRLQGAGQLAGMTETDFFAAVNSGTPLQTTNLALPEASLIKDIRDALQTEQDVVDLVKVRFYGEPDPSDIRAIPLLDRALQADYGFAAGEGYLTTPQGIRAKSGDPSATVAMSVGYYLNDSHNWAVEALVLGAPVRVAISGAGKNETGGDNGLTGVEIIKTKMLPPIVKFGYYFGDRSWILRPYVGVGAMYNIFFDTKATAAFNQYNGGETTVSIKNKLAFGPFLGLESGDMSGWRVGISVGRVKFSTEATLVTRGTIFKTGDRALLDYKETTNSETGAIAAAEETVILQGDIALNAINNRLGGKFDLPDSFAPSGLTTELMKDLAAYKKSYQNGDGTLGTFVRKQRSTLDNTLFMLSVGKSF